jgi:hypothetical protein
MAEYDNKKSGFAWRIQAEGSDKIGAGSIIDASGMGIDVQLLKMVTKNGTKLIRIMADAGSVYNDLGKEVEGSKTFKQIGTLFVNTPRDGQTLSDAAPKFTGSTNLIGMERCSCWTGETDGKQYFSMKSQPPYNPNGETPASEASGGGGGYASPPPPAHLDDDIPF